MGMARVTGAQVHLPMSDPGAPPMPPPGWRNAHLSVSRLKLLEQCALAFYYRYVDKVERSLGDPKGEPAEFGTVLHDALEQTYRWVTEEEYAGPFPTEFLLERYRLAWVASGLTGLDRYQDGRAILRRYASEAGPVDHLRVLAVEREINLLVTPDGVRLVSPEERAHYRDVDGCFVVNGYVDRIDRVDAETIEVVDYKSGWLLFTPSEVRDDLQLSLYAVAARLLYPWAKRVRLTFHMLRHGVQQPAERSEDDLLAAREYVLAMGARSERGPYPPKLNLHCDTCDARDRCGAYRGMLDRAVSTAVRLTDIHAVALEYERVAAVAKAAYAKKARLGEVLQEAAIRAGATSLTVGDRVVHVEQPLADGYRVGELLALCRQAGVDPSSAITVDPQALNALVGRVEADPSTPQRVRQLLRVRIAAKSCKIPGKSRVDVKKKR